MTIEELIDRYCLVWSEPDASARKTMLDEVWADGATYTDPNVHAENGEELLAHIAKIQAGRPGARVLRTSAVDIHHGIGRFAWHLVQSDGTTLPEGLDIVELDPDGARIQRIIGFFGPLRRPDA